ncbi:MAG: hypothetical protein ABI700_32970 [Chloroflexota bacterium]
MDFPQSTLKRRVADRFTQWTRRSTGKRILLRDTIRQNARAIIRVA